MSKKTERIIEKVEDLLKTWQPTTTTREFYSYEDGISTDPEWSHLFPACVTCNGVKVLRVLFCATGDNGVVKSLALDIQGKLLSMRHCAPLVRFQRGAVAIHYEKPDGEKATTASASSP